MVSRCAKPEAKSARLRSHMDWRSDRRTNAALGGAVLAGAASFGILCLALALAGLYAGLTHLELFGPEPPGSPWVDLAVIGGGIAVASLVARLVFRVLPSKPIAH
jgi:hypothetical protein